MVENFNFAFSGAAGRACLGLSGRLSGTQECLPLFPSNCRSLLHLKESAKWVRLHICTSAASVHKRASAIRGHLLPQSFSAWCKILGRNCCVWAASACYWVPGTLFCFVSLQLSFRNLLRLQLFLELTCATGAFCFV